MLLPLLNNLGAVARVVRVKYYRDVEPEEAEVKPPTKRVLKIIKRAAVDAVERGRPTLSFLVSQLKDERVEFRPNYEFVFKTEVGAEIRRRLERDDEDVLLLLGAL